MPAHFPTLDRNRPFGVVFPAENGAHFHQDGFYFCPRGTLVEGMLDDAGRALLKKSEAKRIANDAAKGAIKKALVEAGYDETQAEEFAVADVEEDSADANDGDVDLARWAKGQRKYTWAQVAKAAKEKHGFGATSKSGLITFLVEELRLVNLADVRA